MEKMMGVPEGVLDDSEVKSSEIDPNAGEKIIEMVAEEAERAPLPDLSERIKGYLQKDMISQGIAGVKKIITGLGLGGLAPLAGAVPGLISHNPELAVIGAAIMGGYFSGFTKEGVARIKNGVRMVMGSVEGRHPLLDDETETA